MKMRLLYQLMTIACSTLLTPICAQESVTGNIPTYLETCTKATEDPYYFANFRSFPEYAPILECGFHGESTQYLLNHGIQMLGKMEACKRLDNIGNPVTYDVPGLGRFSGTTLRYMVIADQISKLFNLPQNSKIVEIGAGFGGQCYIMSQIQSFSKYYIYDLPEVEGLIGKVMRTLNIQNVDLLPVTAALPERKIDLVISNYAFSECNREAQLDYFEKVIKKADRGYMIYNQISSFDALKAVDFVQLLEEHHMNPHIYEEPIFTYDGNVLIIWDTTTK